MVVLGQASPERPGAGTWICGSPPAQRRTSLRQRGCVRPGLLPLRADRGLGITGCCKRPLLSRPSPWTGTGLWSGLRRYALSTVTRGSSRASWKRRGSQTSGFALDPRPERPRVTCSLSGGTRPVPRGPLCRGRPRGSPGTFCPDSESCCCCCWGVGRMTHGPSCPLHGSSWMMK